MIVGITIVSLLLVATSIWVQGAWGGLLTFVNMMLAALLATNGFEPLADLIDGGESTYTYVLDFVVFWMLFVVAFVLLRSLTETLSRMRVEFHIGVDIPLRSIAALAGGFLFICILQFSMHLAPIPPKIFQAGPNDTNFPLSPDQFWMGTVKMASRGALENSPEEVFDARGQFMHRYADRRRQLSQQTKLRVRR
jgi:hypothetical protein